MRWKCGLVYTGCPKRYETFLNLNKRVQPLSLAYLMCTNIKEYVKIDFNALLALSSVNVMFPVTSKMGSPNKPDSMNFDAEIGLKGVILGKMLYL